MSSRENLVSNEVKIQQVFHGDILFKNAFENSDPEEKNDVRGRFVNWNLMFPSCPSMGHEDVSPPKGPASPSQAFIKC